MKYPDLLNDSLPPVKSQTLNYNRSINVVLTGNSPRELGFLYNILKNSKRIFNIDAVFSVQQLFKTVVKKQPDCIVLDENLGKTLVEDILDTLSSDERSKRIPITILRNETSPKIYYSAVQTYVIKEKMTKEGVTNAIINAIKSKKNQRYFYTTYSSNYSFLWGTININKAKLSNLLMVLKKWMPSNLVKNI